MVLGLRGVEDSPSAECSYAEDAPAITVYRIWGWKCGVVVVSGEGR